VTICDALHYFSLDVTFVMFPISSGQHRGHSRLRSLGNATISSRNGCMSELLTVQCFENGVISKFTRAIVWDAFAPYAERAAINGWDLKFPDGASSHLNIDDDDEVDGFGVVRPCGGIFFDLIYSVLSKVPSIMIMSSAGFCCVADKRVIEGIPDWLLKALPSLHVVDSGRAITEFLSGERRP
jgi:hypothetical protein